MSLPMVKWVSQRVSGWSARDSYATYDAGKYSLLFRPASYDRFLIEEVWSHNEYFLDNPGLVVDGAIVDVGATCTAISASLRPIRSVIVRISSLSFRSNTARSARTMR